MEFIEFSNKIVTSFEKIDIKLDEIQIKRFYDYMNLLIEWNQKINLTAIIDPEEIIIKHFLDSAVVIKYMEKNKKILDLGTGAGFPGIPLKILNEELDITLVDSLNKRINFLNDVIEKIKLKKIITIHSRAEELARDKRYRESFDILVSRAVANMSVLLEYTLPFLKVGGKCVCMKGPNIEEELNNSKKALNVLGGRINKVDNMILPDTDIERNIIIIDKIKKVSKEYPRKAGKPSKEPIM